MNIEIGQNHIDVPVLPQIVCEARTRVRAMHFNPNPEVLNRTSHPDGRIMYNTGDYTASAPNESIRVSNKSAFFELKTDLNGLGLYSPNPLVPAVKESLIRFGGVSDNTDKGAGFIVRVEYIGGDSLVDAIACGPIEKLINVYIYRPDLEVTTHVIPTIEATPVPTTKALPTERPTRTPTVDATKRALETQTARLAAQATQDRNRSLLSTVEARGVTRGRQEQAAAQATVTAKEVKEEEDKKWESLKCLIPVAVIAGAIVLIAGAIRVASGWLRNPAVQAAYDRGVRFGAWVRDRLQRNQPPAAGNPPPGGNPNP